MNVIGSVYDWTDRVVHYSFLVLQVWAILDCLVRKAQAFPAADKLTKPSWLGLLVIAMIFGFFIPPSLAIISIMAAVIALVYLVDVRPAVRDISGRR